MSTKDFDREREQEQAQRDLTFVVGGETFHIIPFVAPEKLDAFKPTQREAGQSILEVYDAWVISMLVDEDKPLWEKVRKESDPPLELHTIEKVVFYLVEAASGRPTERPSSSRRGQPAQGAGSTGESRSRVTATA